MENLSKTEILFIRACKSVQSHKRLKSLYKRVYGTEISFEHLTLILYKIVLNCELKVERLLSDIIKSDQRRLMHRNFDKASDTENAILNVLIDRLRFSYVKELPGFIQPTRFVKMVVNKE